MEYVFLGILVVLSGYILWLIKWRRRNAWDVLFLNSTLGIIALFMIGILMNNQEVWLRVISFIGVVATGSAVAATFIRIGDSNKS